MVTVEVRQFALGVNYGTLGEGGAWVFPTGRREGFSWKICMRM